MSSKGFTLIELLLVVVIIGIIAALVLPQFGDVQDRAYVSAMQNDLRNLATQQEVKFADHNSYYAPEEWQEDTEPSETSQLQGFALSDGVSIYVEENTADAGYTAWATHAAIHDDRTCQLDVGLSANNRVECGDSGDFSGFPSP